MLVVCLDSFEVNFSVRLFIFVPGLAPTYKLAFTRHAHNGGRVAMLMFCMRRIRPTQINPLKCIYTERAIKVLIILQRFYFYYYLNIL